MNDGRLAIKLKLYSINQIAIEFIMKNNKLDVQMTQKL